MKLRESVLLFAIVFGGGMVGLAQEPDKLPALAPDAPADKAQLLKSNQEKAFDAAIKPYVEQARKTYPDAKQRFLAGLPPKHSFFVTVRLHDSADRWEQVFIAVKEIKDGMITGLIANDIETVSGYAKRDKYSFPESELLDWTMSKPDGTEDGNFVGKFLDTYKPE
ncbi:MAG TPA: DUF2314 domain-containing protein [Pyrinomonadaceae bacterium]|jgi:hypothetical protein|nr:DUF2314 domain-containing protein [Pyrinomonadaceae bacterium]